MKNRINIKLIIALDIVLLVISIIAYVFVFNIEKGRAEYENSSVAIVEESKNPIFRISKIIFYASANAIDNSNGELKNIDISQFSDFQIFIDNTLKSKDLTGENTISEMYIDNIKINSEGTNGEKKFNYKNPMNFGKYIDIENYRDDGILFNVTKTNKKNTESNYDENIFYTDCSNPISLSFLNKNVLQGCEVPETPTTIQFDGSILRDAGINLKDLKSTISFSLHIINNYNDEYVCDLTLNNDLESNDENKEGIYSGYIIKIIEPENSEYNFLRTSK